MPLQPTQDFLRTPWLRWTSSWSNGGDEGAENRDMVFAFEGEEDPGNGKAEEGERFMKVGDGGMSRFEVAQHSEHAVDQEA